MSRNFKLLGIVLAAAFAVSAPATSASAAEFTSSAPTTEIVGGQVIANTITVTGQSATCSTATLSGHSTGTLFPSFTVTPTYTGCTGAGITAKVTGFGHYGESKTCDYVLWALGVIDIVCETGAEVTIDFGTCTVHIPAQTNVGTITYTNLGGGKMLAHINTSGIRGSHTDGFLCPFSGSGEFTEGEMTGSIEFEGTNEEEPVEIAWDE